jgi:pimeloyl-ACP methyl ester carboxylesterase
MPAGHAHFHFLAELQFGLVLVENIMDQIEDSRYPERTTKLVMMDAPVPGVGPWDDILKSPLLWHFRFGGVDMERLVAGRERIYLDRFWNDFAADPSKFDEASRAHYSELYAKPGRMHAGFAQFAAFDRDVIDNKAAVARGRLQMPVLAVGGDHSLGSTHGLHHEICGRQRA